MLTLTKNKTILPLITVFLGLTAHRPIHTIIGVSDIPMIYGMISNCGDASSKLFNVVGLHERILCTEFLTHEVYISNETI